LFLQFDAKTIFGGADAPSKGKALIAAATTCYKSQLRITNWPQGRRPYTSVLRVGHRQQATRQGGPHLCIGANLGSMGIKLRTNLVNKLIVVDDEFVDIDTFQNEMYQYPSSIKQGS
jgi:hypothetical protein